MMATEDIDSDTLIQEQPLEVIGVKSISQATSASLVSRTHTVDVTSLTPDATVDVRRPYTVVIPDQDALKPVTTICNLDVKGRLGRYCLLIFIPVIALIILNAHAVSAYYLSRAFGLCVGAMYTSYFVNFAIQLAPNLDPESGAYLFKVYTRLGRGT